jgi:hypothetical protein
MNLFLSTRSLLSGRERELLTDFLAAGLEQSEAFRAAFAQHLLAGFTPQKKNPLTLQKVESRVAYLEVGCHVDLRLTLEDNSGNEKTIVGLHEYPLAASLNDLHWNLERVLKRLHADGVYLLSTQLRDVERFTQYENFLSPPDQTHHFVWSDLYPLLQKHADEHVLIAWLSEGFETLGLTPPHPLWGSLLDDKETLQQRFTPLWNTTLEEAKKQEWETIEAEQPTQLKLVRQSPALEYVLFEPRTDGTLTAQILPRAVTFVEPILDRLYTVAYYSEFPLQIHSIPDGPIEISVIANVLLSGCNTPQEGAQRFYLFADDILQALKR